MSALSTLPQRLRGEPTVAVIGLGYVGLPLSMSFAETGARVIGVDISEAICARLNDGASHIGDISDERLRAALPRFEATTDLSRLGHADAIVICVPTPLRKTKDPDISHIVAASDAVAEHAVPGQLVVLESTTYPGTTAELLVPRLEARGLKPGQDVAVAFSPERVDPGNPVYDVQNTPKVVGGITPTCAQAAAALYGRACDTVVPVSSTTAAEMVKLLENVFRSVNIGLVNEFALICRQLDVDVWEVIQAASTKPFGFMPFWPGPGLGGHCIPVDPHYLAWKLRSHNFTARFIELADAVNSRMPDHVVSVVMDALNDQRKALRGSRVLVLGVAYKPGISDVRESPALDVIRLLEAKGARVAYHDPHVPSLSLPRGRTESVPLDDAALADCDCALVITHHAELDLDRVLARAPLVVDTRNATAAARTRNPQATVHLI